MRNRMMLREGEKRGGGRGGALVGEVGEGKGGWGAGRGDLVLLLPGRGGAGGQGLLPVESGSRYGH